MAHPVDDIQSADSWVRQRPVRQDVRIVCDSGADMTWEDVVKCSKRPIVRSLESEGSARVSNYLISSSRTRVRQSVELAMAASYIGTRRGFYAVCPRLIPMRGSSRSRGQCCMECRFMAVTAFLVETKRKLVPFCYIPERDFRSRTSRAVALRSGMLRLVRVRKHMEVGPRVSSVPDSP